MALSRIGASADLLALFARSSNYAAIAKHDQSNHRSGPKHLHATPIRSYPEARQLPLPSNVSEIFNTETSRFGPERARDISAPIFLLNAKIGNESSSFTNNNIVHDSRVDSYDCFGTVSLNGAMQSNVPMPYRSDGKRSSYLGMPGGQWSRDDKYIADDMRKSHFGVYRMTKVASYGRRGHHRTLPIRGFATAANNISSEKSSTQENKKIKQEDWIKMSKSERLKIIIRDYGRTVIVFHVGISLVSLGIFYGLVSSGLDLTPMIKQIGTLMSNNDNQSENSGEQLAIKVMSEGSTFLIAYAVHKLFAPLRISATLICTPMIVKYLRRKGVLKPPKQIATNTNGSAVTK